MLIKLRCDKCGARFESITQHNSGYSCPNCGESKDITKLKKTKKK